MHALDWAVDRLPLLTGPMIFLSVWMVKDHFRTAMILGLAAQVMLVIFGTWTGHWDFLSHVLVALAFARNLVPSGPKERAGKESNG